MALSLFARLFLDKTGFDAGMKAAGKGVEKFGSDLKRQLAGAFTVAALTQWLRGTATAVNRIKDLSEQFGITTDEVQKADFALKQAGMSVEDLAGPMNKLASSRRDAVEGNQELRDSFAKFGITVAQLNNPTLRNFDLLMMVAGAMKDGTVAANEQAFIMDLLGTRAGKLANVLQTLSTIEPPKMFEHDDIRRIDEATKAMERFKLVAQIKTGAALSMLFAGIDEASGDLDRALHRGSAPVGLEELRAGQAAKRARMAARPPEGAGLFEVDKNVKDKKERPWTVEEFMGFHGFGNEKAPTSSTGIESDQFQRIGAFTGASAQQAQTDAVRGLKTTMDRILAVLDSKGAKIRGTD